MVYCVTGVGAGAAANQPVQGTFTKICPPAPKSEAAYQYTASAPKYAASATKSEAADQYTASAPKYAASATKSEAADQYSASAPKYAALHLPPKVKRNLNSEI